MFLKVDYCSGVEKDAISISAILFDAIESVGPQNIVSVMIDNIQVCRVVGLVVEGRYDHFCSNLFVIHSLNLMLANIGEIEWINKISSIEGDPIVRHQ